MSRPSWRSAGGLLPAVWRVGELGASRRCQSRCLAHRVATFGRPVGYLGVEFCRRSGKSPGGHSGRE